jgi:ketosteroid isomerase-like protein
VCSHVVPPSPDNGLNGLVRRLLRKCARIAFNQGIEEVARFLEERSQIACGLRRHAQRCLGQTSAGTGQVARCDLDSPGGPVRIRTIPHEEGDGEGVGKTDGVALDFILERHWSKTLGGCGPASPLLVALLAQGSQQPGYPSPGVRSSSSRVHSSTVVPATLDRLDPRVVTVFSKAWRFGIIGPAVSGENARLVGRFYERWNEGASVADLLDPQFEWVQSADAVEPGTFKGIPDARAGVAKIREIFPEFRIEPERSVEVGDEVLVLYRAEARSASGVETEFSGAHVWTVRDDKLARLRDFSEVQEAFDAVGLQE